MEVRRIEEDVAGSTLTGLLRVGVALCFIGHGAFGLLRKEAWLGYFEMFGIGAGVAYHLMPIVGAVDVLVGIAALVWPARVVFLYAAGWALFTAALRPLAGEGVWELFERAGNYGVPLVLLMLAAMADGGGRWLRPSRIMAVSPLALRRAFVLLQGTTALLLLGHGALALSGKPLLAAHVAAIGLAPSPVLPLVGIFEILLAAACIARPRVALFLFIAAWKLGTESLFVVAGDPFWEFIERGGSYIAPLTAAFLLPRIRRAPVAGADDLRGVRAASEPLVWTSHVRAPLVAAFIAAAALVVPGGAHAQHRTETLPEGLAAALRGGGHLLACRHGVTDHEFRPTRPHDFADPTTQRTLTTEGEAQMQQVGAALRALGLVFEDVRASPYHRNMRSAELMFGHARVDEALYGQDRDAARRALFAPALRKGENRAIVTHQSVLRAQVQTIDPIEEGDCLVLVPRNGRPVLVAHVSATAWLAGTSR